MSDRIPAVKRNPERAINSAYWAALQGILARATKSDCNPHAGDQAIGRPLLGALALCWAWGRAGSKRPPVDTVSRETKRPGRGRGRLGPRAEWSPEQLEVLTLARAGGAGHLGDRDLAGIVGKTHDAVRSELARLRKVGGLPPDKAADKTPRRRPERPRRASAV